MRRDRKTLEGKLVQDMLRALLRIVHFEVDGEPVRIDGFRLRKNIKEIQAPAPPPVSDKIEFQDMSGFRRLEPRLEMICKQISYLSKTVDFLNRGEVVPVNSFSLRQLEDWLVPSGGNPAHILDHLAWSCKIQCRYCYLKGNPPAFVTRPTRTSFAELRLRLQYFDRGKALFPRYISQNDETLTHPLAFEILSELRKKTTRCLEISTNGKTLTEESIKRLKELKPVYLNISLTSADPHYRKTVARDRDAKTAIESLPLLRKYGINYFASVVAWPLLPLKDIEKTIRYIDRNEATHIGIYYPGYSRYFPDPEKTACTREHWHEVIHLVRRLRLEVDTPIVLDIQQYEEILLSSRRNEARLLGVIKNSPAHRAGLQWNDLVVEAAGNKIFFRNQLNKLLSLLCLNRENEVGIKVERQGKILTFILKAREDDYPYRADHFPFGIIMYNLLDVSHLKGLKHVIQTHRAERVLFLTSFLMQSAVEDLLNKWQIMDSGVEIAFAVPPNKFLGGNIFVGDLLVVQDYIDFVEAWMKDHGNVDLVIVPSTPFTAWGRDLTGRSYLDIERFVGVKVRLLPCERILG